MVHCIFCILLSVNALCVHMHLKLKCLVQKQGIWNTPMVWAPTPQLLESVVAIKAYAKVSVVIILVTTLMVLHKSPWQHTVCVELQLKS